MPPQLSANPLKVASADALPVTVHLGSMKVRHIEWYNYVAATAGAVITDQNGNDIARFAPESATDLELKKTGNIGYVTGLVVVSISSGEVAIFFE